MSAREMKQLLMRKYSYALIWKNWVLEQVRVYVGCNGCGERVDVDKGGEFTCDSKYCKGKERMAYARYDCILGFAQAACLLDVYIYFYLLCSA